MQNIDDLNKYADEFDTAGVADQSMMTDAPQPGEALGKVGEIYGKVRPFLVAIGSLFFVPKKWRSAILTFVVVMDGLTSTPELPTVPE